MFLVASSDHRGAAASCGLRRIASFGVGICTLLLAINLLAAPITIDNFADPDPEEIGGSGDASPFTDSVTGSAGVLGGDRDYETDALQITERAAPQTLAFPAVGRREKRRAR